jgi:hypothetical protein
VPWPSAPFSNRLANSIGNDDAAEEVLAAGETSTTIWCVAWLDTRKPPMFDILDGTGHLRDVDVDVVEIQE